MTSGKSEAWKHFSCCWSPGCKRWTVCIVPCIKPYLPIMDSHRVGSGRVGSRFSWVRSGRILKFGPACNSVLAYSGRFAPYTHLFYCATQIPRICIARYMLQPGVSNVCLSVRHKLMFCIEMAERLEMILFNGCSLLFRQITMHFTDYFADYFVNCSSLLQ